MRGTGGEEMPGMKHGGSLEIRTHSTGFVHIMFFLR